MAEAAANEVKKEEPIILEVDQEGSVIDEREKQEGDSPVDNAAGAESVVLLVDQEGEVVGEREKEEGDAEPLSEGEELIVVPNQNPNPNFDYSPGANLSSQYDSYTRQR